MTIKQLANIALNRVVINLLEANMEIVKSIPAFYAYYIGLKANFAAIEDAAVKRNTDKRGVTDNKNDTQARLAEDTLQLGAATAAMALDIKDHEMYKRVKCTATKFKTKGAEYLLSFARNLVKDARAGAGKLEDYGYTPADVNQYELLVEEFAIRIADPETTQSTNKVLGQQILVLFRQNRFIHDRQMKPMARQFKKKHPEFYAQYIDSLKLRDPKTNHSQCTGIITNKATGAPLAGVTVQAEGTAYTTSSSRKGTYKLKIPTKGTYTLVFTKAGFAPVRIENVEISIGKAVEVNVEMF